MVYDTDSALANLSATDDKMIENINISVKSHKYLYFGSYLMSPEINERPKILVKPFCKFFKMSIFISSIQEKSRNWAFAMVLRLEIEL